MQPVRNILHKAPGLRTWKEISYIARNVLSQHVAFQQMSHLALERIAGRLTRISLVAGGEVMLSTHHIHRSGTLPRLYVEYAFSGWVESD